MQETLLTTVKFRYELQLHYMYMYKVNLIYSAHIPVPCIAATGVHMLELGKHNSGLLS